MLSIDWLQQDPQDGTGMTISSIVKLESIDHEKKKLGRDDFQSLVDRVPTKVPFIFRSTGSEWH